MMSFMLIDLKCTPSLRSPDICSLAYQTPIDCLSVLLHRIPSNPTYLFLCVYLLEVEDISSLDRTPRATALSKLEFRIFSPMPRIINTTTEFPALEPKQRPYAIVPRSEIHAIASTPTNNCRSCGSVISDITFV